MELFLGWNEIKLLWEVGISIIGNFMFMFIPLSALLVLVFSLSGFIGKSIGLSNLLWDESSHKQFINGVLLAALVAFISYVGYMKDYGVWENKNLTFQNSRKIEMSNSLYNKIQKNELTGLFQIKLQDKQSFEDWETEELKALKELTFSQIQKIKLSKIIYNNGVIAFPLELGELQEHSWANITGNSWVTHSNGLVKFNPAKAFIYYHISIVIFALLLFLFFVACSHKRKALRFEFLFKGRISLLTGYWLFTLTIFALTFVASSFNLSSLLNALSTNVVYYSGLFTSSIIVIFLIITFLNRFESNRISYLQAKNLKSPITGFTIVLIISTTLTLTIDKSDFFNKTTEHIKHYLIENKTKRTDSEALGIVIILFTFILTLSTGFKQHLAQHLGKFRTKHDPTVPPSVCLMFLLISILAIYAFTSYYSMKKYDPKMIIYLVISTSSLLLISSCINHERYKIPEWRHVYKVSKSKRYQMHTHERGDDSLRKNDFHDFSELTKTQENQPLVIFCLSGGGIAAAGWAGSILSNLEEQLSSKDIDLAKSTKLVCGASGGMMAGACWASARNEDGANYGSASEFYKKIVKDSLSPTVQQMILSDFFKLFSPFVQKKDRGLALSNAWINNFPEMDNYFSTLYKGEKARWRPPLAFSPTIIENGKRFIISNVSFEDPNRKIERPSPHIYHHNISDSSIKLATAARLSASFPYVSPAVSLPTNPPVRLVDAGYYDNWGTSLATNWLLDNFDDLPEKANILFVEINAYKKYIDEVNNDEQKLPYKKSGFGKYVSRMMYDLSSPIEAVMNTRSAAMSLKNDDFLEHLAERVSLDENKSLKVISFTSQSQASLGWKLTKKEISDLENEAILEVNNALPTIIEYWNANEHEPKISSENYPDVTKT